MTPFRKLRCQLLGFLALSTVGAQNAGAGVIFTGPVIQSPDHIWLTSGSFVLDEGTTFTTGGLATGDAPGSTHNSLITGAGTVLTLNGSGQFNRLEVANQGVATMVVADGARIDGTQNRAGCAPGWCNSFVGNAAGSSGTLTITGEGSRVDLFNTVVGQAAVFTAATDGFDFGIPGASTTGSINSLDGGALNTELTVIGRAPTGPSSPAGLEGAVAGVHVQGTGSTMTVDGSALGFSTLRVGDGVNAQGMLTILDGGAVRVGSTTPGQNAQLSLGLDSAVANLLVTGEGSELVVANGGTSASFIGNANAVVSDGGAVRFQNQSVILGGNNWSDIGKLRVAGDSSVVEVGNGLIVGRVARPGLGWLELDGGTVEGLVVVDDHGILTGNGTIDGNLFNAGGLIGPGFSTGEISVFGDFSMTSGLLEIEIAGNALGLYDRFSVLGDVSFTGGTIRFSFLDGFRPLLGDTFDFFDFLDLTPTFANVAFEVAGISDDFLFETSLFSSGGRGGLQLATVGAPQPVSEPGSLALVLLGALALVIVRQGTKAIGIQVGS
jgi:hypothetical protein